MSIIIWFVEEYYVRKMQCTGKFSNFPLLCVPLLFLLFLAYQGFPCSPRRVKGRVNSLLQKVCPDLPKVYWLPVGF